MVTKRFLGSLAGISLTASLASCGGAAATTGAAQPTGGKTADAPSAEARDLGLIPTGECSTKGYIAQMGATCASIPSRNVRGGFAAAAAAAAGADGDACTIWNSGGFPPQSIGIDLERDSAVSGVLLVPDMTPPEGDVEHVIEQSNDGDTFRPLVVVRAHMTDNHAYAVNFPAKVTARFLRVTTHASPSWVAWAEVAPVRCN